MSIATDTHVITVNLKQSGLVGEEPIWVLLHGLGATFDYWNAVGSILQSRGTVLVVDLPGFGASASLPKGFDISLMAEAVSAAITPYVQLKNVTIVGHSLGGIVALQLYKLRNQPGDKLFLVDAHLVSALTVIREPFKAWRYPKAAFSLFGLVFGCIIPARASIARFIAGHKVLRQLFLWPISRNPRLLDPDILAVAFSRISNRSIVPTLLSIHNSHIDVPTLLNGVDATIVWGVHDHLLSSTDLERFTAMLHTFRTAPIKSCGHWPMLEHPDELAKVLQD